MTLAPLSLAVSPHRSPGGPSASYFVSYSLVVLHMLEIAIVTLSSVQGPAEITPPPPTGALLGLSPDDFP